MSFIMTRSAGSKRWLKEHHSDAYVKAAKAEGYRSRAAYKLLEIAHKDNLFRAGTTVVDLGAAPGGWSQVARARIGGRGRVIAVDILPMAPLPGVIVVKGDFTKDDVNQQIRQCLGNSKVDLVISDMAPNISGISAVDQARGMHLAELAAEFAAENLAEGGGLLVKLFQGEGFDAYCAGLRRHFRAIRIRKPKASRGRSREVYVIAESFSTG